MPTLDPARLKVPQEMDGENHGIKPPYFLIIDDLGVYIYIVYTPIFEKHISYTKDAFFKSNSFVFFTNFFKSPCHKREFENRSWFSKGFFIVSNGFCSSPKKGKTKAFSNMKPYTLES